VEGGLQTQEWGAVADNLPIQGIQLDERLVERLLKTVMGIAYLLGRCLVALESGWFASFRLIGYDEFLSSISYEEFIPTLRSLPLTLDLQLPSTIPFHTLLFLFAFLERNNLLRR
jgi:hypothetical protein